jgi:glucose-6-phosphate 1-dehydrogenase
VNVSTQIQPVEVFDLVIFGGTGDLALRKLLPALFHRFADGQIVPGSRVIGIARDALDEGEYRLRVRAALERSLAAEASPVSAQTTAMLDRFLELVSYRALDATRDSGWSDLVALLDAGGKRVRVFYLATGADVFVAICGRLRDLNLTHGNVRVVIEKPIGSDLRTAAAINDAVGQAFAEGQTFRIDH